MTPRYGSVPVYDLPSYGPFRVGDEAYIYGQHVRIRRLENIPGGTSVTVERVVPGNSVNSWTDSASNLRQTDDG